MGDGGPADDFKKNCLLTRSVVQDHISRGYVIILNGDIEDGWKFDFNAISRKYADLYDCDYRIQGNHDRALNLYPEAILLKSKTDSILIDHGYAGEVTTDAGWKAARWFVRHFPLNQDVHSSPLPSVNPARHAAVVTARHNWAFERKQMLCYGHIHTAWEDRPYVFNSGCCIKEGGITALIVEGFEIHVENFK
jgi:predicted phosphodiesterase